MNTPINANKSTGKGDIRLVIRLLGSFEVVLDGTPVTGFSSNNVRALLAYLAMESGYSHPRRVLASLLWPDCPDAVAGNRFRNALSNLRQVLGDRETGTPFILSSRETVKLNLGDSLWVDAKALSKAVSSARAGQSDAIVLQQALDWVRGPFLHGLSIHDSPAFEEWALLQQQQIDRQAMEGFGWLAADYERQGNYLEAGNWIRCQLELEPLAENLHQALMRLLVLAGERAAALTQYQTYCRLLSEELGIEPADQTKALYERIRHGELERDSILPVTRTDDRPSADTFVSREAELAKLSGFLDMILTGQGRVALVSGEAGSGKTALLREFARRAMDRNKDVIIVYGTCNAHSGMGDPYLPFRDILQMLFADIEAGRSEHVLTPDHARRLWALLPVVLPMLLKTGPDLIGRFIPAANLVLRAEACIPYETAWWSRLRELAKDRGRLSDSSHSTQGINHSIQSQEALFEQVYRVLQAVSQQYPMILILDDLQWIDAGSASLLFHLGRRFSNQRILIVGAYRPEVVTGADHGGHRHLLEPVVNELRREFGDITVDLDRTEARAFVDALLDKQPNRLSESFRDRLYRLTGGHALFTVELIRDMQESGDLVMDEAGRLVKNSNLGWERLPPRVEAIIAERVRNLPAELQTILNIAAVEGEEFTAEVIAQVLRPNEQNSNLRQAQEVIRKLSGPLGRDRGVVHSSRVEHRPSTNSECDPSTSFDTPWQAQNDQPGMGVSSQDSLIVSGQRLSRYRFRHALFQKYLYDQLDGAERAYLHEAVGRMLEELHAGDEGALADISPALAWHFETAGLTSKAVNYLLQAGQRASEMAAYPEAIALLSRGLDLLATLPEAPTRDRQELDLRLAVVFSLNSRTWGSTEQVRMMERARELCERIGETERWLAVLYLLCNTSQGRGEYHRMMELSKQMLVLAQQLQNPEYAALAHAFLGAGCFFLGDLVPVCHHAEQAMSWYHSSSAEVSSWHRTGVIQSIVARVQILKALALWALGYSDRAVHHAQQARELVLDSHHLLGLGFVLSFQVALHYVQGEREVIHRLPKSIKPFVKEKGLPVFQLWIKMLEGLKQIDEGQPQKGISKMQKAMFGWEAQGTSAGLPMMYILLAEACLRSGQFIVGLDALDKMLVLVGKNENRYWHPEIYRLRGELRLALDGDILQAEADFRLAIDTAQQQQARSWELRATISLTRLWQRQGRSAEARAILSSLYNWFTEGFETQDLQTAYRLLSEL